MTGGACWATVALSLFGPERVGSPVRMHGEPVRALGNPRTGRTRASSIPDSSLTTTRTPRKSSPVESSIVSVAQHASFASSLSMRRARSAGRSRTISTKPAPRSSSTAALRCLNLRLSFAGHARVSRRAPAPRGGGGLVPFDHLKVHPRTRSSRSRQAGGGGVRVVLAAPAPSPLGYPFVANKPALIVHGDAPIDRRRRTCIASLCTLTKPPRVGTSVSPRRDSRRRSSSSSSSSSSANHALRMDTVRAHVAVVEAPQRARVGTRARAIPAEVAERRVERVPAIVAIVAHTGAEPRARRAAGFNGAALERVSFGPQVPSSSSRNGRAPPAVTRERSENRRRRRGRRWRKDACYDRRGGNGIERGRRRRRSRRSEDVVMSKTGAHVGGGGGARRATRLHKSARPAATLGTSSPFLTPPSTAARGALHRQLLNTPRAAPINRTAA